MDPRIDDLDPRVGDLYYPIVDVKVGLEKIWDMNRPWMFISMDQDAVWLLAHGRLRHLSQITFTKYFNPIDGGEG